MTTELHIVSFLVDPFLGTSFPIGALVCTGGRATFVEAPHLPGAECLGGQVSAALLANALRVLRASVSANAVLPSSSLRTTATIQVPSGVEPEQWAETMLAGKGRRV